MPLICLHFNNRLVSWPAASWAGTSNQTATSVKAQNPEDRPTVPSQNLSHGDVSRLTVQLLRDGSKISWSAALVRYRERAMYMAQRTETTSPAEIGVIYRIIRRKQTTIAKGDRCMALREREFVMPNNRPVIPPIRKLLRHQINAFLYKTERKIT